MYIRISIGLCVCVFVGIERRNDDNIDATHTQTTNSTENEHNFREGMEEGCGAAGFLCSFFRRHINCVLQYKRFVSMRTRTGGMRYTVQPTRGK